MNSSLAGTVLLRWPHDFHPLSSFYCSGRLPGTDGRATSVPAGGARGDDDKATWLAGAVADEAKGARAEENNKVGGRG